MFLMISSREVPVRRGDLAVSFNELRENNFMASTLQLFLQPQLGIVPVFHILLQA